MSIAVSAVVTRSSRLSLAISAMCGCVLLAGFSVVSGAAGELPGLEKTLVGGICCLVAAYVFFRTVLSGKVCEIHVSGTGQIRLQAVSTNDGPGRQDAEYSVNQHGEPVRLLPVSTLWSWLLVLHLRHENGRTSILAILPDAVGEESFRALLVACRWITARCADES
ncbi:MAG TPA: protein YgfX [Oxalicibacterium sp.]|jgi:hypothetical protein|nr:protein YgfX [Oxalicibacterium sp.]